MSGAYSEYWWKCSGRSSHFFNRRFLTLARESRGLTTKELANKMMRRESHVIELETGLRTPDLRDWNHLDIILQYPRGFYFRQTEQLEKPEITWWDGDGIVPCDNCGQIATFLCDYPVGEGKTCSQHICSQCRTKVGGYDFCPEHTLAGKHIGVLEHL